MRVFVSHAGKDRPWAEWVAWHLRAAGYAVEIDLDWRRGDSFMAKMRQALQECDVMVALYSPAYFADGSYTLMELDAWLARLQRNEGLVPLRVAECDVPNFYRPYVWSDLFGRDDDPARGVLLRAVPPLPAGTTVRPRTPGEDTGPRVPGGALPAVWSVPAHNPDFVGRDALLTALRGRLAAGSRAVVQALHGWGGVGKTSLANEYAHRFAGEYDLVWWIDAEKPELIGNQIATLAVAASVVPAGTATPEAAKVKDHLRRPWSGSARCSPPSRCRSSGSSTRHPGSGHGHCGAWMPPASSPPPMPSDGSGSPVRVPRVCCCTASPRQ
jgi:hypothetical protein